MTGRPRAVILVGNPAGPYSRALRLPRTLAEAGYDVEIACSNGRPDAGNRDLSRIWERGASPNGAGGAVRSCVGTVVVPRFGSPTPRSPQRLHLSDGTVRNYLSEASEKLVVTNRTAAARLARDRGWL
jgi:hypothetical protein